MEWVLVFICFEIMILFIIRYQISKQKEKNLQELSYEILYAAFAGHWIFFIISDYYAPTSEVRAVFLNCGYFTLLLGASFSIFIIERDFILMKKNLFSYIALFFIIIFTIVAIIDYKLTQSIVQTPWPFYFFFFVCYFLKLIKNSPNKSNRIINFLTFLIGFGILGTGYFLTIDLIITQFGIIYRLIGDILLIIGQIFLIYFYTSLPLLSEFDWQKKIEKIYLIDKSGIPIFLKSYDNQNDEISETILPGALSSIQIMLKTLTKIEKLTIIRKKNQNTIIYPGKYIIGVVISKYDLKFLRYLIKKFVDKVENIYSEILPNWNRDPEIFRPVIDIFQGIFKEK